MEELARQLEALANKNARSLASSKDAHIPLRGYKRRKHTSFLWTAEKSAEIDSQTIYLIGLSGLDALAKEDDRFDNFRENLFHTSRSSPTFTRKTQYEHTLKKINANIDLFLELLTPFFLLEASHKVIEFLIRRYEVHVYNISSLMKCALPYIETNTAGRLFQILALSDPRWRPLLKQSQEKKVKLSIHTLLQGCMADTSILEFVGAMAKRAAKLQQRNQNFKVVFNLYASVAVQLLPMVVRSKKTKWIDILPSLLPSLFRSLRSWQSPEFQAAGYLANIQLCRCATQALGDAVVSELLKAHVKKINEDVRAERLELALQSLAAIVNTQDVNQLPSEVVEGLLPFSSKLKVPSEIVLLLVKACSGSEQVKFAQDVLKKCENSAVQKKVCEHFLLADISQERNQAFIRFMQEAFPGPFDIVLRKRLSALEKKEMRQWLAKLELVLKGTRNEVISHGGKVRGPLSFSLNKDKSSKVRLSCAETIRDSISKGDADEKYIIRVSPMILEGLQDSSNDVVKCILGIDAFFEKCPWEFSLSPVIQCLESHGDDVEIALMNLKVLKMICSQTGAYPDAKATLINHCFYIKGKEAVAKAAFEILQENDEIWKKFKWTKTMITGLHNYLKTDAFSFDELSDLSANGQLIYFRALVKAGGGRWLKELQYNLINRLIAFVQKNCLHEFQVEESELVEIMQQIISKLKISSNQWFAPVSTTSDALSCLQNMYLLTLQDASGNAANHLIKHMVNKCKGEVLLPFLSSFLTDSNSSAVIENTLVLLKLLVQNRGLETINPLWCYIFSLLRNPTPSIRRQALNFLRVKKDIWQLIESFEEEILVDASFISRELPTEMVSWVVRYIGWLPPQARYPCINLLQNSKIEGKNFAPMCEAFSALLEEMETQETSLPIRNEALAVCVRKIFGDWTSDGAELYSLLERYLSVLQNQNFILDEGTAAALKTPIFKVLNKDQRKRVLQAMTNIWRSNAQPYSILDVLSCCIDDSAFVLDMIDLECPVYSNLLEFLRVRPTALKNYSSLVVPLFNLVQHMNTMLRSEPAPEKQTVAKNFSEALDDGTRDDMDPKALDPFSMEYHRRTVLSILTEIIRASKPKDITKTSVNIAAIVSCVQFQWPEHSKTRTAALRLLSRIASVDGLQQEVFDAFIHILEFFAEQGVITNDQKELNLASFQQILLTSIPYFPNQDESANAVQESLMISLVAALQKVHFETQTPVLKAVIEAIDETTNEQTIESVKMLPRAIALILATNPVKVHTSDSSLELCSQLLLQYDPIDRLDCMNDLVDNTYWGKKLSKSPFYNCLKCFSKIANQQSSTLFKSNLADLMVLQLNRGVPEEDEVVEKCLELFKKIFVVLDDMGTKVNERFSGVAATLEQSLNILMRSIPIKKFAKVLSKLFVERSAEVRLRAVALACEHVSEVNYSESAQRTYLKLLPRLRAILDDSKEIVRLKQNVLLYLETMLSTFDDEKISEFEPSCRSIIAHIENKDLQKNVFSFFTAFFKISSSIEMINLVCPKLTEIFPKMLSEEELSPGRVHSFIDSLAAITAKSGMFITRYIPVFMSVVVNVRVIALGKNFSFVELALRDLVKNLSKIEGRHLVPVMTKTYDIVCSDPDSLIQLFHLATLSIGNWDSTNAQKHHQALYLFLISALELRSTGSFVMTSEVEDAVISSFLALILKLKPSEMQALFRRFLEWVGIENQTGYYARSLTFFRFMQAAMTKFQKLFSPFFSMSLQLLVSCLKESLDLEDEEPTLQEPPRKRRKLNSESQKELMKERQTAILRSSEIFFTLEEENLYMNKGSFNLILEPLCQQLVLARILQKEDEYLRWTQAIFIPAIVAFADTTAEDVLLMALNGCLVKHSRSSSAVVRLASVEAITKLFQTLRVRYLSCLTETLVSLDELMQDSDDRMQERTKALIEVIEDITGERIEDHIK